MSAGKGRVGSPAAGSSGAAPAAKSGGDKERRKEKGLVFSVPSGDRVVLLPIEQASAQQAPKEKEIALKSLRAPRLGNQDEVDEPFAWESREFLRKKLIGKMVEFQIQYKHEATGREYGNIFLNGENIAHSIVRAGLAAVFRGNKTDTPVDPKKPPREPQGDMAELLRLESQAQEEKIGIHTEDPAARERAQRPVSSGEDYFKLFPKLKGKELDGVVEFVHTGSTFRITLLPSHQRILVRLAGAEAPVWKREKDKKEPVPEPFAAEARFSANRNLLHRDVKVILTGVDSNPNEEYFYGMVLVNGLQVAFELLKGGFAKYIPFSAPPEHRAKMEEFEREAQEKKFRIWRAKEVVVRAPKGPQNDFFGKVKDIGNGPQLVVEDSAQPVGSPDRLVNVTLSSINIPRHGDTFDPAIKHAWAWEAREFLRKKLIGKKVHVILDYIRPENKEKNIPAKRFYTVLCDKKNIANQLVERGFAYVLKGEQKSSAYLDLIQAENRAAREKKGLHTDGTPKEKPPHRITILSSSVKQCKSYLPSLKRQPRMPAIVEYVYAGARFSIYIPAQNCQLTLALVGVQAPSIKAKEPFAAEALEFARDNLHLHDVEVEIENLSKACFIGNLWTKNGENFAVKLLEEGLANLHEYSAKSSKFGAQLVQAELSAKRARKNKWHDWDEAAELEKKRKEAEEKSLRPRREIIKVLVTEVIDGGWICVQTVGEELKQLAELSEKLQEFCASAEVIPSPSVGSTVGAQFSADNLFYRAKILEKEKDSYRVQFIDYGNAEVVPASALRALDPSFLELRPQSQEAVLAFLKTPSLDEEFGQEAALYLRDLVWNKELVANVEKREGNVMHLSLGDEQSGLHVNAALLRAGFASLARIKEKGFEELMASLSEEEEQARKAHRNIWKYGGFEEEEEDEEDY